MRRLPLDHPGTPETRTPGGFLWWMARRQWPTLAGGMFFGIVWMSAQAVMPAVIGHAIDDGVAAKDREKLLEWAAVLFGIGLVQTAAGIAARDAVVDGAAQDRGHHGLAAHPDDAERHPAQQRAPLAPRQPPEERPRRPVHRRPGVVEREAAHSLHGT